MAYSRPLMWLTAPIDQIASCSPCVVGQDPRDELVISGIHTGICKPPSDIGLGNQNQ